MVATSPMNDNGIMQGICFQAPSSVNRAGVVPSWQFFPVEPVESAQSSSMENNERVDVKGD